MPKPTKIVVHFDDGSTYEIPAQGTGSIFLNEEKAKRCGHNPPYGKPPKGNGTNSATDSTTTATATDTTTMSTMEAGCYILNGVVVCP
jgi:hypothetical protein